MRNRGKIIGPVHRLNFHRFQLFRPARAHFIQIGLDFLSVARILNPLQRLARALIRRALGKVLMEVLLVDLVKVGGLVGPAGARRIDILLAPLNQIIVTTLQILRNIRPDRRYLSIAMIIRVRSTWTGGIWRQIL